MVTDPTGMSQVRPSWLVHIEWQGGKMWDTHQTEFWVFSWRNEIVQNYIIIQKYFFFIFYQTSQPAAVWSCEKSRVIGWEGEQSAKNGWKEILNQVRRDDFFFLFVFVASLHLLLTFQNGFHTRASAGGQGQNQHNLLTMTHSPQCNPRWCFQLPSAWTVRHLNTIMCFKSKIRSTYLHR